jgi:hypothetical protein
MNKKINTSQICVIKVFRKAKHGWIKYKPEKKYWFYTIKEKFVDAMGREAYTREAVENMTIGDGVKLYIENNCVYYNPHVEIYLSNEHSYMKGFKNNEELDAFLNSEEISHIKWIEV